MVQLVSQRSALRLASLVRVYIERANRIGDPPINKFTHQVEAEISSLVHVHIGGSWVPWARFGVIEQKKKKV